MDNGGGLDARAGCPACGFEGRGGLRSPQIMRRCRACRAAYWADAWNEAQVSRHYHGYYRSDAADYDPLTERRYHAILREFERMISATPRRLVDLGCGIGHFLTVAEARGWAVVGVEVSRSAIETLERVKRERGLRFSIIGTDAARAGLPSASFDVATLFEVVEHVQDPVAALAEAHRLLKEGGLLYLTTPNYDSLSRRVLGRRWRVIAPEHRCLFTPGAMRRCLRRQGFRPLRLMTKNLDVPELLAALGLHRQSHPTDRASSSQRMRHAIEDVAWLRHAKAGVNGVLRVLHGGDTLEVLAIKRRRAKGTS